MFARINDFRNGTMPLKKSREEEELAQNSGTLCDRISIEQAAMAEPEVEAAWSR
jgi:hypothetical protein